MIYKLCAVGLFCGAFILIGDKAIAQVTEVRVGITEFDERSLSFGPAARFANENSLAVNGEILFEKPQALKWAFSPHPYIGVTLNLEDKTSFGGAGLLWRKDFGDTFYGDLSVGVVAHDGTNDISDFFERLRRQRTEIQFGSTFLFREQIALGVNVNEDWSSEIFYEHLSNAYLGSRNPGVDNLGVRLVKKFD